MTTNIYSILQELANTTKTNEKKRILHENKSNQLLVQVIKFALNPFVRFYLQKIPEYEVDNETSKLSLEVAITWLEPIYTRQITGNQAKKHISSLLSSLTDEDAHVVKCILMKDLRCGVGESLVNGIWPKLIPSIPLMKAEKKTPKSIANIRYPAFVDLKEDGQRTYAIVNIDDRQVDFITGNGNPLKISGDIKIVNQCIDTANNIRRLVMSDLIKAPPYQKDEAFLFKSPDEEDLKKLAEWDKLNVIVLDGEALVVDEVFGTMLRCGLLDEDSNEHFHKIFDWEYPKFLPRKKGNGVMNHIQKGTPTDSELDRVFFSTFDFLTEDMFNNKLSESNNFSKMTYEQRQAILGMACDVWGYEEPTLEEEWKSWISRRVFKTPSTIANCYEDVKDFYKSVRKLGMEGLIVKNRNGLWEDARSKNQIKFKAEIECDLLVTGIEDGVGKYVGMIGALVCESSCGKLKTNVGSGLSDDDRKKNPNDYLGKIVKLTFNETIQSEDGSWSLFLPRVEELRNDKSVADSLEDVFKNEQAALD